MLSNAFGERHRFGPTLGPVQKFGQVYDRRSVRTREVVETANIARGDYIRIQQRDVAKFARAKPSGNLGLQNGVASSGAAAQMSFGYVERFISGGFEQRPAIRRQLQPILQRTRRLPGNAQAVRRRGAARRRQIEKVTRRLGERACARQSRNQ